MNTIIEQALQLSKEEKLELYYALQEDLEFEGSDELTDEQWKQLNEITEQMENGRLQTVSEEEMMQFLKNRRKNVSSNL